jgi:hypothetical protein
MKMQSSGDKFVVYKWGLIAGVLLLFLWGCSFVVATPLPTEIDAAAVETSVAVIQPVEVEQAAAVEAGETAPPEINVETGAPPPPEATIEAGEALPSSTLHYFLQELSMRANTGNPARDARALPRHGLIIAFVLPLIIFGIPWMFFELFIIRYVQPRSIDLSTVRIKAQDGLFIEATLSMTARRNLSMASTRMTWSRVQNFMEKIVEQELIHEAIMFPTIDDLERNIKDISEKFLELPVLQELNRDFGVEVMRFNIESFYPQETIDALNRKAEASAGGAAYLAYAAAAHLDPDTPESRELYRIYQQTTSRVDAYRNLGSGIAALSSGIRREEKPNNEEGEEKKK